MKSKEQLDAYHEIDITEKQFYNCLFPLYEHGSNTAYEIAELTEQEINKVSGRFSECKENGLIVQNVLTPTKKTNGRKHANYILTKHGKEAVVRIMETGDVKFEVRKAKVVALTDNSLMFGKEVSDNLSKMFNNLGY